MCKIYGKEPDDPFFDNMDPIKKHWLYESWAHEQELELEKSRSQAILIGSFYNPEAAKKMAKTDEQSFESSDVDKTLEEINKEVEEEEKALQQEEDKYSHRRRRKKRKVLNNG